MTPPLTVVLVLAIQTCVAPSCTLILTLKWPSHPGFTPEDRSPASLPPAQLALKAFLALLPTICVRMAWLRGSPNLARVEADATLNLWRAGTVRAAVGLGGAISLASSHGFAVPYLASISSCPALPR